MNSNSQDPQLSEYAKLIDLQQIIARAKAIILTPTEALDSLQKENVSNTQLLVGYLLPLTIVSRICSWLGLYFVGLMTFFSGFVYTLLEAVLSVVLVYAVAVIAEKVLPKVQSQATVNQSVKLFAYAMTPSCVAGVLAIVPVLTPVLALVGIYSLYLFYKGIPKLLTVTPEKQLVVFGVMLGIMIVSGVVGFWLLHLLLVSLLGLSPYRFVIPQVNINLGNLDETLKQLQKFSPE